AAQALRLAERLADQARRMQRVTTALSGALSQEQVAQVILDEATGALGAVSGGIWLRVDEPAPGRLELLRVAGISGDLSHRFVAFSLDAALPLTDAVRGGEPIWLETRDAYAARYP